MIEIEHLTKRYGAHTAVSDLTIRLDDGGIYGFLGPNGAGKSTTMNIMTGCLSATEGHVRIGGFDIFEQPQQAKRLIGYLPEQPPLYLGETPLEYLRFVGEAKGLRGAALTEQIADAVARTGIGHVQDRRISTLSKGYRQRVGIAQALLGDPQVIILDEPTVGLDPLQIVEIRELVKALGRTHTVIFSSHILSEVQAICDRILILSEGRLAAFGTPEELEQRLRSAGEIVLTAETGAELALAILGQVPHITDIDEPETADGAVTLRLRTDSGDIHAVSRDIFFAFARTGTALLELSVRRASLEDVFLKLTDTAEVHTAETAANTQGTADDNREVTEA